MIDLRSSTGPLKTLGSGLQALEWYLPPATPGPARARQLQECRSCCTSCASQCLRGEIDEAKTLGLQSGKTSARCALRAIARACGHRGFLKRAGGVGRWILLLPDHVSPRSSGTCRPSRADVDPSCVLEPEAPAALGTFHAPAPRPSAPLPRRIPPPPHRNGFRHPARHRQRVRPDRLAPSSERGSRRQPTARPRSKVGAEYRPSSLSLTVNFQKLPHIASVPRTVPWNVASPINIAMISLLGESVDSVFTVNRSAPARGNRRILHVCKLRHQHLHEAAKLQALWGTVMVRSGKTHEPRRSPMRSRSGF